MSIRFLKYASVWFSITVIMVSLLYGGWWVLVAPLYVFGLIPLIELFSGGSQVNMTQAEEELAKKDFTYDLIVWSVVPLQFALMFFFLNRAYDYSISIPEKIGMMFAFGIACGVLGINVAHE
ncbi:MAG TPA: hypothetical protein PLW44_13685, partial [Chitinophagales bacterium]|nr:hypothetical protein [Chitinophagales bacterium]